MALNQPKKDLNRSRGEDAEFPNMCENCLPAKVVFNCLKEANGAECKLCSRAFTVFTWKVSNAKGGRLKTTICQSCARNKNCCQSCMLDLAFNLPLAVRDAALKMVAPGPNSDINREYAAQQNDRLLEDGSRVDLDVYDAMDSKGRELLTQLANSKHYFRKGPSFVDGEGKPLTATGSGMQENQAQIQQTPRFSRPGQRGDAAIGKGQGGPGPIRSGDSRAAGEGRGGFGGRRGGKFGNSDRAEKVDYNASDDYIPPADGSIKSLYIMGIEDDLPEYKIREFFVKFGPIKSIVISHRSHLGFVNYDTRAAAEAAQDSCKGKAVIEGNPIRVRWAMPNQSKVVDGNTDRAQRARNLADARVAFQPSKRTAQGFGQNQGQT